MDWMNAATRLLSGDMEGIAAFHYRAGQCAHLPPNPDIPPLPRATPESQGVSSHAMIAIYQDLNQALEIEPHGLMILRHGRVIAESHWSPYLASTPQMLYSLSKSLVSTAVGLAIDDGLISLDDTAAEILQDALPADQDKMDRRALAITVRHLLTMSAGTSFNEALTLFSDDWTRAYFDQPLLFDPGSAFKYNSMNTYLLSALVRRRTGQGLMEYLTERIFRPIGVSDAHWDLCPKGIEKGGWGLAMTLESMCRVGQLYLQGGVWGEDSDAVRLISEKWIREAASPVVHTRKDGSDPGYGYQIWMCCHTGAYQFNGAFGQYMIVIPDLDMVIAMTSANGQVFADDPAEAILWSRLEAYGSVVPAGALPEDPEALAKLRDIEHSNRLYTPGPSRRPVDEAQFHNRMYRLERNRAGLLPSILQTVYANFTRGNDTVVFLFEPETPGESRLVITEGNDVNTLRIGLDGEPRYGTVSIGGQVLQAGCVGSWSADSYDHPVFTVRIGLIETPDTRFIRCVFLPGDAIRLEFAETPTATSALEQLNLLIGALDFANRRLLVYALKRHGTQIRIVASGLMTPVVEGKLSI
ncbi:MAG TPA: serine hydrolase domain-containing protein [Clostridia bacterium]